MEINKVDWENLEGGYKIPYNAFIPLEKLRLANSKEATSLAFEELWTNLHHQGDVGLVSYYAIPFLVSICIDKQSLDWNYIALCVTIEHCRTKESNPELSLELKEDYFSSLNKLGSYLLNNFNLITEKTALQSTLALLSILNNDIKLSKAIFV